MDMLHSRYACPMDMIHMYIEQERFGEFVKYIIDSDVKRKQEESDRHNEDRLWMAYVHSMSDKSFNDWKDDLIGGYKQKKELTNKHVSKEQIVKTINDSMNILEGFKMEG